MTIYQVLAAIAGFAGILAGFIWAAENSPIDPPISPNVLVNDDDWNR